MKYKDSWKSLMNIYKIKTLFLILGLIVICGVFIFTAKICFDFGFNEATRINNPPEKDYFNDCEEQLVSCNETSYSIGFWDGTRLMYGQCGRELEYLKDHQVDKQ